MTQNTIIIAAQTLLLPDNTPNPAPENTHPILTIQDGSIRSIDHLPPDEHALFPATHRFPESALAPAYLDIHIHGCAGHDVMDATPESLNAISSYLATRGVGAYLPTTVTSPRDETLRSLSGIAAHIHSHQSPGAIPLGIHLEGPFLSPKKRGVHTESLLEAPSIPLFDRFWQASEGYIRLLTIAPELPGALDLINHATSLGVRCSLGHSNAHADQAHAGFLAGATSATHTFNAMRAIDHRSPGIAAYVLDHPQLFAEIICDGIHVDPLMVRLFYKSKGPHRAILVTDGISATGMPDGTYTLGDLVVEVKDHRCTSGGVLSGSVLTLDQAVRNLIQFTQTSRGNAIAAATRNPAQLLGLDTLYGTLEPNRPASITILSPTNEVLQTFIHGTPTLP